MTRIEVYIPSGKDTKGNNKHIVLSHDFFTQDEAKNTAQFLKQKGIQVLCFDIAYKHVELS